MDTPLDQVLGPLIIAAALFIAILSNFLIRGEYLSTLANGNLS